MQLRYTTKHASDNLNKIQSVFRVKKLETVKQRINEICNTELEAANFILKGIITRRMREPWNRPIALAIALNKDFRSIYEEMAKETGGVSKTYISYKSLSYNVYVIRHFGVDKYYTVYDNFEEMKSFEDKMPEKSSKHTIFNDTQFSYQTIKAICTHFKVREQLFFSAVKTIPPGSVMLDNYVRYTSELSLKGK